MSNSQNSSISQHRALTVEFPLCGIFSSLERFVNKEKDVGGLLSVIFINLRFVLLYHLFLYHIIFNEAFHQLDAVGKEEFGEFFYVLNPCFGAAQSVILTLKER